MLDLYLHQKGNKIQTLTTKYRIKRNTTSSMCYYKIRIDRTVDQIVDLISSPTSALKPCDLRQQFESCNISHHE